MSFRVLMFGWELPPHNSGGLGTACEGLTRALLSRGVEVIFVLPKTLDFDDLPFRLVFAGLERFKLRRVPGLLYPYLTIEDYGSRRRRASGGVYGGSLLEEVWLYADRARAIVEEETFDVIHAHDWLSFPAGLVAKEASGKPLVVHVHATEFDRTGGRSVNQEVYEIEKRGMEEADQVVTVSEWTKNLVMHHYGIPAEKIRVVHNGVAIHERPKLSSRLERLRRAGRQIVLFVGRITLQKGPDYFVAVAKRVLQHCPETYFVMVGWGDMAGQVIQAAAGLGISDRLIFTGFLRGTELDAVYQAADLYVLPSVSEPFGITPLEALANGTPVLVSRQSGVSEVLHHALKVDFWDLEEMTNQIVSVLKHRPLQLALAQNGAQEARGLTWDKAAQKCVDCYRAATIARA